MRRSTRTCATNARGEPFMPQAVITDDRSVSPGQRGYSDEWLLVMRRQLERHREFRREQLAVETPVNVTCPSLSSSVRDATRVPELREVAASIVAGAQHALANIEAALLNMDHGRYGICDSCEANISVSLLEAIPETLLCLDCQQRPGRNAHRARSLPAGRHRHPSARKRPMCGRHHGV